MAAFLSSIDTEYFPDLRNLESLDLVFFFMFFSALLLHKIVGASE